VVEREKQVNGPSDRALPRDAASPLASGTLAESSGEVERRALAGRAGIVGAGTLVSRLLGLVRDQTLAALFPRGQTDAFWVAFVLPNALRSLLGEGAASSAVVPVLAEVRAAEGESAAREFFRAIRGVSMVALIVVTVLGIFFAPWLVELFASGLHARPGAFEQTVELTRWVFPYIFFMGTAALGMAALNTYGRYTAAAFAPALLNVAMIAAALLLSPLFRSRGIDPVLVLAVGALIGGFLQVVAQWPSLFRIGFAAPPRINLRHPRVRQALGRLVPMLVGIGIYEIDLIFSRRFLSELPEGSVSYYSFAQRLCDFPQGVFVLAMQTATLPSLSKLVAARNLDEVGKTYAYAMRLCLFVALPATVLLVGLSRPIVSALFERGAFDATSSVQTSRALMAQGVGIWMVAAVRQLLPVFYALGDTRTPVLVSAIDLLALIAAAIMLRGPFGHVGVSMAVTISSAVQMTLLWVWLSRRIQSLRLREIGVSALRTLGASLAAMAFAHLVAARLDHLGSPRALVRILPGAVGVTVFSILFFAFSSLLKAPELSAIAAPVRRRFARRTSR
jgi:putative peptidoglycan lipid II flippase